MSRTKNTLPDASEIDAAIAASKYLPPAGAADSRVAAADAAAAADTPPRLTGGDQETQRPLTGERIDWQKFQDTEYFSTFVTDTKGRLIEVPLRRGRKDAAFIDYLTFTFHQDSIIHHFAERIIGDNEFIQSASDLMNEIFGFGISQKMLGKGKFFYQSYYQLGPTDASYGTLHHGGQRDTVLVDLNAVGCQAAKPGWELRLFNFFQSAMKPRITRCDVAHDFFQGEYTPEQALTDHRNGLFDRHNVRPKRECRGTAWQEEDGTGKTLYVGRKGSSRLVRVYEKGKKFGDKNSPWVRFEIEFRKHDCVIPLDMLIYPGQYLTGAYDVGANIFKGEASRIETVTNIVNLTFEQRIAHAKNQVGRLVRFLVDAGFPDSQIINYLCGDEDKYPKGLHPAEYNCDAIKTYYLHHEGFAPLDLDEYRMVLDDLLPTDQEIASYLDEVEARKRAQQLFKEKQYPYRYPQDFEEKE